MWQTGEVWWWLLLLLIQSGRGKKNYIEKFFGGEMSPIEATYKTKNQVEG